MADGSDVLANAEQWIKWDKNEKTRGVIESLLKEGKLDELSKLLGTRQTFGTAGIRGRMEAGSSGLNDLVIIQTTQGLYKYLRDTFPDLDSRGIIVGFDARYHSAHWARIVAAIFVRQGVKVYLFPDICPTPFVAYGVKHFGTCCGVMVTASHNPKDDNGYKVYWENSAQILPPHDKNIQQSILECLEPLESSWDLSILEQTNPLLLSPLPSLEETYFSRLKESMIDLSKNSDSALKFTFTPIHGVSQLTMVRAFETCGFKPFVEVPEQKDPNPDFPTAPFPNPEEGKTALACAFKSADAAGSTVILANDPDADRMAVAEKTKDGSWRIFNGNEIGALLGHWLWQCYKKRHAEVNPADVYMIASAVSSKFLDVVARREGFNFMETLTGFKWMGNKAEELITAGKVVLFAYEEAIGFMSAVPPLDKDGITACMKMAELAVMADLLEGKTLAQKLEDLYIEYGYHKNVNSYYLCYEPTVTKRIFERIRHFGGGDDFSYPEKLGEVEVKRVRDLTVGVDTSTEDRKPLLPTSKSTEMITFYLANECEVTLRTSGTEPKIKYYTEMRAPPGHLDWKAIDEALATVEAAIVKDLLQPELNGLKPHIS